ncbi:hypothetical protein C0Q70_05178 [Pomacea canaliculata]|uniref:ATP-dependent RNA helicase n=1 Tax=Pomacea canaliculata TaxID=400727 RepID=A0A2T7PKF5_POMCA|nr:hypothetical protein C0Q70_05178 [Pomacea canaliculata]
MSLFVVNRFTGEESKTESSVKEDRLKKLKEEITKRKEQRRQRKEPNTNIAVSSLSDQDCHSVQRSGKRKKKSGEDESFDSATEHDRKGTHGEPSVEKSVEIEDVEHLEGLPHASELNDESETVNHDDPNVIGGFSVLGNFQNKDLAPVKRALPDWLANPSVIKAGLKRQKIDRDVARESESDMAILDEDLRNKLQKNDISRFFPVQKTFIPVLLQDLKYGTFGGMQGLRPRDICVSAPTGSGKTLAFVLPIIQSLKCRTVPHVRAVVVLPVRDLAEQVYAVFKQYCAGTSLKVSTLSSLKLSFEPFMSKMCHLEGLYHSLVDILVATPGRLVDHISSTPGFDLTHLRFLVIDEADRMMEDIKHDWLSMLETSVVTPSALAYFPLKRSPSGPLNISRHIYIIFQLQKLLFSATLSHNPEKLQQLNLFMPCLLTSVVMEEPSQSHPQSSKSDQKEKMEGAEDKVSLIIFFQEYFVQCSVSEKPLLILHFLHYLKFRQVLCFTNTLEATHRLYLLVKLYGGIRVCEFSSRLQGEKRKKILKKFSKGQIDLLICSDAMARGMDIENVKFVISYDHPPYLTTYIHRVGRTARAGKAGTSVSFLEKSEIFHFKKMMRESGKWPKIQEMKINRNVLQPLVEPFRKSLGQLSSALKMERKKKARVNNKHADQG